MAGKASRNLCVPHKQELGLLLGKVKSGLKEGFEYRGKGGLLLGILLPECSSSLTQARAPSF